MGKYFGTDGIRGVAGKELTPTLAYKIGQSLHTVLNAKEVVIGKDTRESSDMLALHIAAGATALGVKVYFAGTCSTPMVALYSREHEIYGIMITASHNPFEDNGIKVFDCGSKLSAKQEEAIETFIDTGECTHRAPFGFLSSGDAITKTYEKLIESLELEKVNLTVGYDSANGANIHIAKRILEPLVDEGYQINAEPNGNNINLNCGSTHIEAIKRLVEEKKCDIGFSFDGDGDRVLVVDHRGRLYDGDMIVYIIATYLKAQNALAKNTVVLTKMSNPGIIKAFKSAGIKVIQTDVGDKYVSQELFKGGLSIGGENSGHIILKDLLPTGDGLLVAVYLLKILQAVKTPLHTLVEAVTIYPQKMENIRGVNKQVVEHKQVKQAIKEAQKKLGDDALLLVRPSGTEPLVRVTISHQDEALLDAVMTMLVDTVKTYGGESL